jgi:hypothetical protein
MEFANEDICRTPKWYPEFAEYTFLTSFVKLHPEEIKALSLGVTEGPEVDGVIERLAAPMKSIPGNCFVFVDSVAPTDTERFRGKRGAVYSPQSAWRYLAESEKVRIAASEDRVEYVCIRPFRRMSQPREFRLFIYDGKLKAMSQYWLIRHFRRLEGPKQEFWEKAERFVEQIAWILPCPTVVMDIYFTSGGEILIIDFNPWGEPTKPLLMRSWDIDWNEQIGIKLIPPPTKISGDINVSP